MDFSIERWRGQVAVITGASSGIGAATSKLLVKRGIKVVGLDLLKDKGDLLCEELQNETGQMHVIETDVTKEDQVVRAFGWVEENIGPISILVNSAGVSRTTTLVDGNSRLWRDVLDTNVFGLCLVTREAVRDMRKNGIDGQVVHINSYGGHNVLPFANVNLYCGSKFAVTALTETLRKELNMLGSKIKVTSISPGLVMTDIYKHNAIASGFGDVTEERKKLLSAEPVLQAEDVAQAILYVLSTPPHLQVQELSILPVGQTF